MTEVRRANSTAYAGLCCRTMIGGGIILVAVNAIGYLRNKSFTWRWGACSIMLTGAFTQAVLISAQASRTRPRPRGNFNNGRRTWPPNRYDNRYSNRDSSSESENTSSDSEPENEVDSLQGQRPLAEEAARISICRSKIELQLDQLSRQLQGRDWTNFSNASQVTNAIAEGGRPAWNEFKRYTANLVQINAIYDEYPAEWLRAVNGLSLSNRYRLQTLQGMERLFDAIREEIETLGEDLFWGEWQGREKEVHRGFNRIQQLENATVQNFCIAHVSQRLLAHLEDYIFAGIDERRLNGQWEQALQELGDWLADESSALSEGGSLRRLQGPNVSVESELQADRCQRRLNAIYRNYKSSVAMAGLLTEAGFDISHLSLMTMSNDTFERRFIPDQYARQAQHLRNLVQALINDTRRERTRTSSPSYAVWYRDSKIGEQADEAVDKLPAHQWTTLVERVVETQANKVQRWHAARESWPQLTDTNDPVNCPSARPFIQAVIDCTLSTDQHKLSNHLTDYMQDDQIAFWECVQILSTPDGNGDKALHFMPHFLQLIKLYQAADQVVSCSVSERFRAKLLEKVNDLVGMCQDVKSSCVDCGLTSPETEQQDLSVRLQDIQTLIKDLDEADPLYLPLASLLEELADLDHLINVHQVIRLLARWEMSPDQYNALANLYCLSLISQIGRMKILSRMVHTKLEEHVRVARTNKQLIETDGSNPWHIDPWVQPGAAQFAVAVAEAEWRWAEEYGTVPNGQAEQAATVLIEVQQLQTERERVPNLSSLLELFQTADEETEAQQSASLIVKLYRNYNTLRTPRTRETIACGKEIEQLVKATITKLSEALVRLKNSSSPINCQADARLIKALRRSAFVTSGDFRGTRDTERMCNSVKTYCKLYKQLQQLQQARDNENWGLVAQQLRDFTDSLGYVEESRQALAAALADGTNSPTAQLEQLTEQIETELSRLDLRRLAGNPNRLENYEELATKFAQAAALANERATQELPATTKIFLALFDTTSPIGRQLAPYFGSKKFVNHVQPLDYNQLLGIEQLLSEARLEESSLGCQIRLLRKFAEKNYNPLTPCPLTRDRPEKPVIANCGSAIPHVHEKEMFEGWIAINKKCGACNNRLQRRNGSYSRDATGWLELMAEFDTLRSAE